MWLQQFKIHPSLVVTIALCVAGDIVRRSACPPVLAVSAPRQTITRKGEEKEEKKRKKRRREKEKKEEEKGRREREKIEKRREKEEEKNGKKVNPTNGN